MMTPSPPETLQVRSLSAEDATVALEALVDVLLDAVEGGASVSFLWPLSRAEAREYWTRVVEGLSSGQRVLWGAWWGSQLVGTVQLVLDTPPNQRHRAEVSKLLVHRAARRRGVGRALMQALEEDARARGRTLLTLDTRAGDAAEPLYLSLGYQRAGVIPRYALSSQGVLEGTVLLYKELPWQERSP